MSSYRPIMLDDHWGVVKMDVPLGVNPVTREKKSHMKLIQAGLTQDHATILADAMSTREQEIQANRSSYADG